MEKIDKTKKNLKNGQTKKDSKIFDFNQLTHPDESKRLQAWIQLFPRLPSQFTVKEIKELKVYFFELLKSETEDIRAGSWWYTPNMLDEKIIDKNELREYLPFLGELSKSTKSWSNPQKAFTIGLLLEERNVLADGELENIL